jgi:SAM-dependent methyltransferase
MSLAAARRASGAEILDAGAYAPEEMRGNLADLRFFNAWMGGTRLALRATAPLLARARPGAPVSVLDVATGSADILASLGRRARRRRAGILGIGMDTNADVLEEARRFLAAVDGGARLVRGDARSLPWRDGSVDVALCSNFLHHLGQVEAVEALREMRRVCRLGVVVVDLMRTRAAWYLVWLTTRLTTRNRLTRHDGILSIERAFTPIEMARLAREAGMPEAAVAAAGPVRMVLRWRRPQAGSAGA